MKDGISQYNYTFLGQPNGTLFTTDLANNNLTLGDFLEMCCKNLWF